MVGLLLAACGFEPLHQSDDKGAALVARLDAPKDAAGVYFSQRLSGLLASSEGAPFEARFDIVEATQDSQLDSRGVALRQRLDIRLTVSVRRVADGKNWQRRFSQSGFIAQGASGVDDMMRRKAQRELALDRLADRAAGFIRSLPTTEANQ